MNHEELKQFANACGTPAYLFDMRMVKDRISMMKAILPENTGLCFAVKANPFLIPYVAGLVDRLEVCSPGEYEICIRAGIDPSKIVVSGVNKTYASMKEIFTYSKGKGIYTIESKQQYQILEALTEKQQTCIRVMIRLSSGNQFGVDADMWMELSEKVRKHPYMELCGVHYYAGTQKKQAKIEKELDMLLKFLSQYEEKNGERLPQLEYGPGLMVSYFVNDSQKEINESDPKRQLQGLADKINNLSAHTDITIETGRFLVSECGYYMTRIMDKKENDGHGYLILDGGIHQIHYYGWMMGMKQPDIEMFPDKGNGQAAPYHLCGSLCTVNDVLAHDVLLCDPQIGDVLCLKRCGAYAATEGIAMFLSREMPQIFVCKQDGSITKCRDQIDTSKFQY